jgi:DNA-binding HxlR family transcriptional regulator
MLGRTYDGQNCSVAKTLELVGERWTVLILREIYFGRRRFDEIADGLGIARNVLTQRLQRLVEEDVLTKVAYQERPQRFEYRLTDKGLDLYPVLLAMSAWGDRYAAPADGPPITWVHRGCGAELTQVVECADGHRPESSREIAGRPGPGARRRTA